MKNKNEETLYAYAAGLSFGIWQGYSISASIFMFIAALLAIRLKPVIIVKVSVEKLEGGK